ncbi:MAG: gamma-glutamyl-gamma-aminobutyrate hydrolase family protein [Eubacteriaceae bacterium]|nr:gamma-glutamyl-gamma-aminobutyrate hydrolase family protein [Eubacteriaceae bacterium]
MHKPLIGLAPLIYDDKTKINMMMYPRYTTAVEFAGGIPIILPLTDKYEDIKELVTVLDGIILTGGEDVNPSYYGEEKESFCGKIVPELDAMEDVLFKESLKQNKPVFGICRGCQFINASLGGTLYQDLPTQRPSDLTHQLPSSDIRFSHKITAEEGSLLHSILGTTSFDVNSFHHQGIKDLAPGLVPIGYADDGLIEAVYMPSKNFVFGVQWHPEFHFDHDPISQQLFKGFLDACRETKSYVNTEEFIENN